MRRMSLQLLLLCLLGFASVHLAVQAAAPASEPALNVMSFVPMVNRTAVVVSGLSATACNTANIPRPDATAGVLQLVVLKYDGSCYAQTGYSNSQYTVQVGRLTDGGSQSYTAYSISPPAVLASAFLAGGTGLWMTQPVAGNYSVWSFSQGYFTLLGKLRVDVAGTWTRVGSAQVDSITATIVVILTPEGVVPTQWTQMAPGITAARLMATDGFVINARSFDLTADTAALPTTAVDFDAAYPFPNNYGTLRRFFAVYNSLTSQEGVAWQDPSSLAFMLTWFASDYASSSTIALPLPTNHVLQSACGNGLGEVAYLSVYSLFNSDGVTTVPVVTTRVSSTGDLLAQVTLNSNQSGIDLWRYYSSGSAMEWDVARGRIGVLLTKLLLKDSGGINHENGISFLLNSTTMKMIGGSSQTSSHCFGNSLQMGADGNFLMADISDNIPRSLNVRRFGIGSTSKSAGSSVGRSVFPLKTRHSSTPSNGYGTVFGVYSEISTSTQTFYKWSNDNNIYTEMARKGLIETPTGLLVFAAAEYPPLDNAQTGSALNGPRNLAMLKVPLALNNGSYLLDGPEFTGGFYGYYGGWTPQKVSGIQWLTSFPDTTKNVARAKTIRLGPNQNLAIYEVRAASRQAYQFTQMILVDDMGVVLQSATVPGLMRLPGCDDLWLSAEGKAVFYMGMSSGQLVRYEVSLLPYHWHTSDWPVCNAPCNGTSTQTRSILCADVSGATVDNSFCGTSMGTQPATSQTCSGVCANNFDVDSAAAPAPLSSFVAVAAMALATIVAIVAGQE